MRHTWGRVHKKEAVNMEENKKTVSWLELDDEELKKLTDVSVCMYGKQNQPPK